jgi:ketosteroid isomerase-like protein
MVGLFGLAVLGTVLYLSRGQNKPVVVNNRPTLVNNRPTPTNANMNANANMNVNVNVNSGRPPSVDTAEVSKEVADALEEWADSTRERDLDAHMSCYADTLETYYKKQNVPAAQVRADRSRAFVRYDDLKVKLSNVEVTPDPTGTRATAAFDKTWEFDSPDKNSKGSVRQQLTLVRVGTRWLITGERDLQVYYTNSEEY